MWKKSTLNQELTTISVMLPPPSCFLVDDNYKDESLVSCPVTKDWLHTTVLCNGSKTAVCSLLICRMHIVFSLLPLFFFPLPFSWYIWHDVDLRKPVFLY